MSSPLKTISILCLILGIIMSIFAVPLVFIIGEVLKNYFDPNFTAFFAALIIIPVPVIFFVLAIALRQINKKSENDARYLAETIARLEKEIKSLKDY